MELRDLRTFVAVAGLLSFHRAGEALHAAQSTVSARIAAIESDLGVKLFERLGRRVALTEAGERLFEYARKILDLEDEARAWVLGESEARGSLTVRAPESLCACRMGPVIRAFRERFPHARLCFTACTMEGLEKDLRQGVTDLAFLMADSIRAGDLAVDYLGAEPLVLVSAPGHRLAGLASVGPDDLSGETLVLSTADCSYRKMFEGLLSDRGVATAAGISFSSAAALRGCIMDGVGVSILPELAVRGDVEAGRLATLNWSEGELETAVLMIRHKDKWLSPPLKAFMEMARETLMGGAPVPARGLGVEPFAVDAAPKKPGRCC
jgi:DNA-binding transcriptional LysR family regulator